MYRQADPHLHTLTLPKLSVDRRYKKLDADDGGKARNGPVHSGSRRATQGVRPEGSPRRPWGGESTLVLGQYLKASSGACMQQKETSTGPATPASRHHVLDRGGGDSVGVFPDQQHGSIQHAQEQTERKKKKATRGFHRRAALHRQDRQSAFLRALFENSVMDGHVP